MEYLYGALIAWVVISWTFFILVEAGLVDAFLEDKALWFLFAPMWILVVIVLPVIIYKNNYYVVSRMKWEEMKQCSFVYKQISKHWWLFRLYGNKKKHPILYYVIVPMYIKIQETP